MTNQQSSSPLSSIPEHNKKTTTNKQQPARKRSKANEEKPNSNKRPRRQSATLKKTYEENPLFHTQPQTPSSPAYEPTQTNNKPDPNPSPDPKSKHNTPKTINCNPQQTDQSRPPANHIHHRLWIESQGSRSFPAHLRSYGPLWEPPALIHLVHNQLLHQWEIKSEPIEASPVLRKRMQAAEANLPYAPAMQLLSDLGWYKTKWNADERRVNDRWGGWYDQTRLDLNLFLQSRLDDQQILEYLPTGVQFPAPLEQDQPSTTQKKPARVIRNTLTNQWAVEENNEGSLSLYAGPLSVSRSADGTETIEQERITFQRFASCRLNTLIPEKAGFVLNASAPVWSIDFLPAPEFTTHSSLGEGDRDRAACDFIALATISSDPGLVPPTEIAKLEKDAKSVVQIWSIPHAEPTNFHEQPPASPVTRPASRGTRVPRNSQPKAPLNHDDCPQLVMLLAFSSQATVVRWCPRGGTKNLNKTDSTLASPSTDQVDPLGLLAISFVDGSVGLYSVPHPFHATKLAQSPDASRSQSNNSNYAITLDLAPVAKLMLPSTTCLTLDWANHDVLAGGCTNGSIVIWHVETLLQLLPSSSALEGPLYIRPSHYKPVHSAPVKSISWIRTPPVGRSGKFDLEGDPAFLTSTGYDGSVKMVDVQDLAASKSLIHERGETTSLAFSPVLGCLNLADSDYSVKSICLKPRELGVSKKILVQLGLVWQLAASDFHSFIAYAAADGVCGLASLIRPQKYRSRATMWAPKVYQMDFSRKTSELRMLDNLVPEPRSQDGTSVAETKTKARAGNKKGGQEQGTKTEKKKADQPAQSASSIGAYASVVGVHCLSWNKSITRGSVLASGMGCGLVRVDLVEGGLNSANNSSKLTLTFDELITNALDSNNQAAGVEDDDDD
ncbi:hypothetical protein PGT21_002601 [Puccinia graminis f. sp. tritici]|uniref:Uncharacterized protein n=1 Tax=Puccinia graminis f. sp. tritici TaxID=56615 RepID=A0A5B0N2S7_PUCGR|nr:hypothetical protein PGT21_002601 [Puccinia graminis f. sp. tritici]KAA1133688.1 hypothetical protein PGTUg99_031380 [Puccinia graminis f. sp. tritici]